MKNPPLIVLPGFCTCGRRLTVRRLKKKTTSADFPARDFAICYHCVTTALARMRAVAQHTIDVQMSHNYSGHADRMAAHAARVSAAQSLT